MHWLKFNWKYCPNSIRQKSLININSTGNQHLKLNAKLNVTYFGYYEIKHTIIIYLEPKILFVPQYRPSTYCMCNFE